MTRKFKLYIFFLIVPAMLGLTDCEKGASPDNTPDDTTTFPDTRFKVLNYLYKISGNHVVAGIHNREPNNKPAQWTDRIFTTTGKYPGMWSGDFLFQEENINDRQTMVNEALSQWKKGAVIGLMWHACNPALNEPCDWNSDGVLSKMSDAQWNDLLTDGTAINAKWKSMMDEVVMHLQVLEDNGVEVLWRPLHEMNQGAFWWGGRPGAEGTRKLYQLTHDYFTKTKGLTNLIWVWDLQDFESLPNDVVSYNPGNEYWDVLALDIYDGASGYSTLKYTTMVNAAEGKPIAIGECQTLPSTAVLTAQKKWTFFMSWSELTFSQNTDDEIKAAYKAPSVNTLDELPGW